MADRSDPADVAAMDAWIAAADQAARRKGE